MIVANGEVKRYSRGVDSMAVDFDGVRTGQLWRYQTTTTDEPRSTARGARWSGAA